MKAALLADVLNGQRQTCLITGDGFVLGTVVLKDAVQVLEPRAEKHVPEEDGHFQRTFEDDARPAPQRDNLHDEAGQKRGQKRKQEQRQHNTDEGGAGHEHVLHSGGGVFLEPFVQLGLGGLGFTLHRYIGGVH